MLLENDPELLTRFREGEPEAMELVFNHYSDEVAHYLTHGFSFNSGERTLFFAGVRHRYDLHDLLAETFRRAFEQRARMAYSGISPYGRFLKQIARNLTIDRLRANSRIEVADVQESELENEAVPSPEQCLQAAELTRLMEAFVDDLTEPEQRFVALRYFEGMSQEQVALDLSRSRRWVRNKEKKVRKRLLNHLRHTGYLPKTARGKT